MTITDMKDQRNRILLRQAENMLAGKSPSQIWEAVVHKAVDPEYRKIQRERVLAMIRNSDAAKRVRRLVWC